MMRSRQIFLITTAALWLGCLLSIFFVMQSDLIPASSGRGTAPNAKSVPSLPMAGSPHPVQMLDTAPDTTGQISEEIAKTENRGLAQPLNFPTRAAFIEYFRYQYSENELEASYQRALSQVPGGGKGGVIVVASQRTARGKKFDDKYKVKIRFNVKPVPQ